MVATPLPGIIAIDQTLYSVTSFKTFKFSYKLLRYSPTTTSHTRYTSLVVHACLSVDREIITRVPTNSHACKTRVIPTRAVLTRVPYIFCSLIGVRVNTSNTAFYATSDSTAG